MRAGVTSASHDRSTPETLDQAVRSGRSSGASAGARARSFAVRRRQGRRRHDDAGVKRRDDRWRALPSPTCCSSTCTSVYGDAARVPRRRAALLGGRRAREHAPPRRGVLQRPRREDQGRLDLLGSSDRADRRRRRPAAGPRRCSNSPATRTAITVLDVPRSDVAVLDALEVASHDRASSPTRSCRRCAAPARLAHALRTRYGADRVMVVIRPLRPQRRDRAGRRRAVDRRHGRST